MQAQLVLACALGWGVLPCGGQLGAVLDALLTDPQGMGGQRGGAVCSRGGGPRAHPSHLALERVLSSPGQPAAAEPSARQDRELVSDGGARLLCRTFHREHTSESVGSDYF